MTLIRFCVHSQAAKHCAYEESVFFEIWSPLSGLIRRIECDGSILPSLETTTSELITASSSSIGVEYVKENGSTIRADLPLLPKKSTVIKPSDVVLVIYVYAWQPRTTHVKNDVKIIRHVSSGVVFGQHLKEGGQVVLQTTHHSEGKWLSMHRQHMKLHVDIAPGGGVLQVSNGEKPEVYWERVLQQIWDGFIGKEVAWKDRNKANVLAITPFSLILHGIPVSYDVTNKMNDYYYSVSKGLSAQSLWLPPTTTTNNSKEVVSDKWVEDSLKSILSLRGATLDDFLKEVYEQKCLSDVVKLVTYHASTWPYSTDHALVMRNGLLVEVMTDTQEVARSKPGDCEDSAAISIQIALDIMKKQSSPSKVVQCVRRCLAILGVPCGLSGTTISPKKDKSAVTLEEELDLPCHMFAAFIPLPMFHSMMFPKESFPTKHFCEYFGFKQMPEIPLHAAIVEGTMMSTPFYTSRTSVTSEKIEACTKLKSVLQRDVKEDLSFIWRNYTTPHVFAFDRTRGIHMHYSAYRLFTFALPCFYGTPEQTTGSFVMYSGENKLGIPVIELFKHHERIADIAQWKLKVSTDMPRSVYDLEQEVIEQFIRPTVTLQPYAGQDANRGLEDRSEVEYIQLKQEFNSGGAVTKDRNRRVTLYMWKIIPGQTKQLIQRCKEAIKARSVHIQTLFHGYAVVFNL